ncbi:FAD-binding domain-containing protein [Achaetomium macrosporum]|uniref:FAD-binding domain-containing protein n=1 Tax=Achaetomium macrosporum TaxID=79813 RepID=A0AAN7CAZ5_9PEZI|nr:FAD-binding domain-containing protein [Achaetomium macrosporum]
MKIAIALLSLSAGWVSDATSVPRHGKSACQQLAVKFSTKTYFPGSKNYTHYAEEEINSATCVLDPGCVFTPASARDVADALRIIRDTRTTFSVVSGGHMPVPGAQSNNGGVMIAMANINAKTLNAEKSVASIGPGNRWIDVYKWISPYGLAVAGGRYSDVGVGGLLVGGGINYFGNQVGWSVNTLVGVQVVLGDGSIIEANKHKNEDLFWALKGGGNNFGIVTRYDMTTIPLTAAYGGLIAWQGLEHTAQFIQATQDFLVSPDGIGDPFTEINPTVTLYPNQTGGALWQPVFNPFVSGNYSGVPRSIQNYTNIPNPVGNLLGQEADWVNNPIKVDSVNTVDVNGHGQMFGCLAARVAPGLVQLHVDTILKPAITALANVKDAFVAVSPEPISKAHLEAARRSGEYAIDLDPADGPFVVLLTSLSWANPADDETMLKFMETTLASLKAELIKRGIFYDYIYLNDAAPGQKPFPTYGKGKSLPRLKRVQAKYDRFGVFKNLITSGFKL